MPGLYQLRQVRSKFDSLSTYTKCRSSSSLSSRAYFQPTTIWTLSAQDGTSQMLMSQDKIGPLVSENCNTGIHQWAMLHHVDDINEIALMAKDKVVSSILSEVRRLFDHQEKIDIIGNSALNIQLVNLENKLTKKRNDEKQIHDIVNKLYD